MSESENLTGVELRRAAAEKVGWEWHVGVAGEDEYAWDGLETRFQIASPIDFNDALAACEAAGLLEVNIVRVRRGSTAVLIKGSIEQRCIGSSEGTSPESLLRALLRALEAKHERA